MKKLFFIVLASTLVLALTNCVGGDKQAIGAPTFDPNDTLSTTNALAMYVHYMDSNVNKNDSAIIRQIFPPVEILKEVLKTKDLTGFKLLVGAYLNDDSTVLKRNQPMVLMQLKIQNGDSTTYKYYDLNTVSQEVAPMPPPYCPPPPACLAEG